MPAPPVWRQPQRALFPTNANARQNTRRICLKSKCSRGSQVANTGSHFAKCILSIFQVRPDLIFRPSTRAIRGNRFIRAKERRGRDLSSLRQSRSDLLQIVFHESHAADTDCSIGIDQEDGRNIREPIRIGSRIALLFFVQSDRKRDSVLFRETRSGLGIVLGNAEKSDVVTLIPLIEPLQKGKRKLTHRTRNLKECRQHRTFSPQFF